MSCGCGGGGFAFSNNERGDENALVTTIERFTADRFSAGGRFFVHEVKRNWNAIAIGSRSMFDRCYIIGGSHLGVPIARSAFVDNLDLYMSQAVEVSVERPHIGHIEGPVIIAPPYSQSVANGGRISGMVDSTSLPLTYIGSDNNQQVDDNIVPHLDLVFYKKVPPFIPTKRAPWEYVAGYSQFGTTGISTTITQLPGWGRNRWHLALNFTVTSGSVDYTIAGIDIWSDVSGTAETHTTILVPTTTVTLTSQISHVVTEGFDIIQVNITENAAMGANSSVALLARGYD